MTDEPRGHRTREGVKDAMIAALQRELTETREALRACEAENKSLRADWERWKPGARGPHICIYCGNPIPGGYDSLDAHPRCAKGHIDDNDIR